VFDPEIPDPFIGAAQCGSGVSQRVRKERTVEIQSGAALFCPFDPVASTIFKTVGA
jgi:hypothetical protein